MENVRKKVEKIRLQCYGHVKRISEEGSKWMEAAGRRPKGNFGGRWREWVTEYGEESIQLLACWGQEMVGSSRKIERPC